MSKDYNVFLKNADNISSREFELYAFSVGLQIRMYPVTDLGKHFGFLPFNLRASFMETLSAYDSFLSGFEICFSQYSDSDYDAEFNSIMSGVSNTLLMSLDGEDFFQELVATVFSGYLCKCCGGILYDPQTDKIYTDLSSIESKIEAEKANLIDTANKQSLRIHPFTGWK